jgi:arginase family enzyme
VAVVVLDGHCDAVPAALRAASVPAGPSRSANSAASDQRGRIPPAPELEDPGLSLAEGELEAINFENPSDLPLSARGRREVLAGDDEVVFPAGTGREVEEAVLSPEAVGMEFEDAHGYLAGVPYGFMSGRLHFRQEWLCGDFLAGLMKEGAVLPANLYVVGVNDYPGPAGADTPYGQKYLSWVESGVKVYSKKQALALNFGRLLMAELDRSPARMLYVSLDADVGALASMMAARFMDKTGLPEERILGVAQGLRELLEWERFRLAGVDLSEIEVHFLGLEGPAGTDHTARVCALFAATLLGNMTLAA